MNCPTCRLSFEEEERRTLYLSQELECKICLLKKESFDFDCLKCGHAFCKECINCLDKETRNNNLSPELWINSYYPTLQYVTYNFMQSRQWPSYVVDYVQLYWYTYPTNYTWPVPCNIYYRFISDINNVRHV